MSGWLYQPLLPGAAQLAPTALTATSVQSTSELSTPVLRPVPRVWLNTSQTKSGATEMTVTAFNEAGTSVTFTDPAGAPTGSLYLGVENTGTGDIGWIAVTVSAGTVNNLLAEDVQSTSNVTTPVLGQTHVLLADDVQSTSQVTAPVIGQVHALLANDVQSTSEVSVPVMAHIHVLNAADVQSTSEVTSPVVGQVHVLNANDVQSTSQVTVAVIGQTHALLAVSVQSTSSVSTPALAEVGTGRIMASLAGHGGLAYKGGLAGIGGGLAG